MLIMRAHRGVNMKCLGLEVNHTGTESLEHFGHIRFFQTAFVLDNRDLTAACQAKFAPRIAFAITIV